MSDTDSDPDVSKLAREVIDELDSGRYGDKFVFSRRQVIALAGAGLSVGGLTTLGVDEATAQEAVGQVGTASEPVDVEAANVNAGSVNTDKLFVAESGIVDFGDVDPDEVKTENVSFDVDFDSTPILLLSAGDDTLMSSTAGPVVSYDDLGTGGFRYRIINLGSTSATLSACSYAALVRP